MTQTPSTFWRKIDSGLYLTSDEKSISAIVCNKEGTKCKGMPFSGFEFYPVTGAKPVIVSTGKYMDGYFVAYFDESCHSRLSIHLFKAPTYETDVILKPYHRQLIESSPTDRSRFIDINLVQKKANPTEADYTLYISLQNYQHFLIDFPVESTYAPIFTYLIKKVDVKIQKDFALVQMLDFSFNEDGTPSKVGILGQSAGTALPFREREYEDLQQYFIIQDEATWVADSSMPKNLHGLILKEDDYMPAVYVPSSPSPFNKVQEDSYYYFNYVKHVEYDRVNKVELQISVPTSKDIDKKEATFVDVYQSNKSPGSKPLLSVNVDLDLTSQVSVFVSASTVGSITLGFIDVGYLGGRFDTVTGNVSYPKVHYVVITGF